MKTIAKALICISTFVSNPAYTGTVCSFSTEPMVKLIPQEYVFFGEVVGFVGPIRSMKVLRDAWGLKVRLTHGFNLPKKSGDHFEVYPLGLTNACEKTGASQDALVRFYPTGSKVRVVGFEATQFDPKSADGTIRLSMTEMDGAMARQEATNINGMEGQHQSGLELAIKTRLTRCVVAERA